MAWSSQRLRIVHFKLLPQLKRLDRFYRLDLLCSMRIFTLPSGASFHRGKRAVHSESDSIKCNLGRWSASVRCFVLYLDILACFLFTLAALALLELKARYCSWVGHLGHLWPHVQLCNSAVSCFPVAGAFSFDTQCSQVRFGQVNRHPSLWRFWLFVVARNCGVFLEHQSPLTGSSPLLISARRRVRCIVFAWIWLQGVFGLLLWLETVLFLV